ncbi:MAG: 50S ribosomal protein L29 [Desulfovibrio sp.]|uniref:50S ribosomal protein L29 n=1 Tax=Desulfovibrio sp. 7SRBS1 TaxID=3378064 RepID=UPI003B3C12F7
MKMNELKSLDEKALAEKLGEFRKELFNMRFQHTTAQLEQTHKLKVIKKTIARILTVMHEKRVGA